MFDILWITFGPLSHALDEYLCLLVALHPNGPILILQGYRLTLFETRRDVQTLSWGDPCISALISLHPLSKPCLSSSTLPISGPFAIPRKYDPCVQLLKDYRCQDDQGANGARMTVLYIGRMRRRNVSTNQKIFGAEERIAERETRDCVAAHRGSVYQFLVIWSGGCLPIPLMGAGEMYAMIGLSPQ